MANESKDAFPTERKKKKYKAKYRKGGPFRATKIKLK